jgi:hypothetical protein
MGKSEEEKTDDDYKDGAVTKNALQVITIIGEIEGHDNLPATSKATKYEHMLPKRLRWIKILKVYFLL